MFYVESENSAFCTFFGDISFFLFGEKGREKRHWQLTLTDYGSIADARAEVVWNKIKLNYS